MRLLTAAFALFCLALTGCGTYNYRIVQPNASTPKVADKPVTIPYDPLEYQLSKDRDHLAMLISNPTGEQIVLVGKSSFAVDPRGESHPIRDRIIGPHSYTRMLVPPVPFTYAYPYYWGYGPGWGWGWGAGYYGGPWYPGPWYGPWYWGPPAVSYSEILTAYDWKWKEGPVRLRLTYEHGGKTFEHDFEFLRELDKSKP